MNYLSGTANTKAFLKSMSVLSLLSYCMWPYFQRFPYQNYVLKSEVWLLCSN